MLKINNTKNNMMDISEDSNEENLDYNHDPYNIHNNKINEFNMNVESEKPFPLNLSNKKNSSFIAEVKFKNYIPIDKSLTIEKLNYFDNIVKVEKEYEKKVRKAIKDFINLEKNPLNIVPKKNNLDLKRNLGEKLSKLNRRTEISILELISILIFYLLY